MKKSLLTAVLLASTAMATPASAAFTITATYAASIASDPNAAAIEGAIDAAILVYENLFTNNINIPIIFQAGGGLGSSSFSLFDIRYSSYSAAQYANAHTTNNANQLAAVAANPIATFNPVTGTNDILMKCATIDAVFGAGSSGCASYGTITLNTSLTTPGSPASAALYALQAVAAHEIDEILGLGSTLGLALGGYTCGFNPYSVCTNVPSPEDLFRYTSGGARSFTTNSSAQAFFSVNGSTDLAEFNQSSSGDYGDWKTGATSPQVQDAFSTPGSSPILGTAEITALNVIGYNLAVPEPATLAIFAVGAAGLAGLRRAEPAAN